MLKGPILYKNLWATWIITSFMCTGEVDPATGGSTGMTFILLLYGSVSTTASVEASWMTTCHCWPQANCTAGGSICGLTSYTGNDTKKIQDRQVIWMKNPIIPALGLRQIVEIWKLEYEFQRISMPGSDKVFLNPEHRDCKVHDKTSWWTSAVFVTKKTFADFYERISSHLLFASDVRSTNSEDSQKRSAEISEAFFGNDGSKPPPHHLFWNCELYWLSTCPAIWVSQHFCESYRLGKPLSGDITWFTWST